MSLDWMKICYIWCNAVSAKNVKYFGINFFSLCTVINLSKYKRTLRFFNHSVMTNKNSIYGRAEPLVSGLLPWYYKVILVVTTSSIARGLKVLEYPYCVHAHSKQNSSKNTFIFFGRHKDRACKISIYSYSYLGNNWIITSKVTRT